jgi:hypothetical protein
MVVWYACALAEAESKGEELEKGAGQGEWETRKRLFRVEKRGELTRGMCVVDRRYVSFLMPFYRSPSSRAVG